jgi:hypothetical protein
VWHLQYSDWQEQGLPRNVSSYLQFLEELSELRRLTVKLLLENLIAVLRIRITLMRFRILFVTLTWPTFHFDAVSDPDPDPSFQMRIRIQLIILMRIWIHNTA